jgi:hypothetical protein
MAKVWVWNQGYYGYRCRHCSNLDWLAYQEAEDVRKQAEHDAYWCCDGALVPLLMMMHAGGLNDTADHETAGGLNEVAESPRDGHCDGVHLPAGDPAREQTDDATDGSSDPEAGGSLKGIYSENWGLEPAPEPGITAEAGEPGTATEQCLASTNDLSMSCSIRGTCSSEFPWENLADDDSLPVQQDVETMDCSCGSTFATGAVSCPGCGTSPELISAENKIERQVKAYLEAEAALESRVTLRGTLDCARSLAAHMADAARLDADDADRLEADDADDALVFDEQWEADYDAVVQQFLGC